MPGLISNATIMRPGFVEPNRRAYASWKLAVEQAPGNAALLNLFEKAARDRPSSELAVGCIERSSAASEADEATSEGRPPVGAGP